MSPSARSKSKDKSAKAAKGVKTPLKSPTPANNGNSIPGSAYNPISGTFHTVEATPSSAPSSALPTAPNNGRFGNIDETEEHSGSSLGTAAEYDSQSNNDSCSGESEDTREKNSTISSTQRVEPVPGSDTDKRDKVRQKNERKHQRQKEKRAQELHERCSGYIMSRKLEALAQKLVAMGFSSERATSALIRNEGRVEESVVWLLDGGEESDQQRAANLDRSNIKINMDDEIARIATLERKYKCTKQEVERAVVACEGDLDKAEDNLKSQKQEPTSVPSRLDQAVDSIASTNKLSNKLSPASQNPSVRTHTKGVAPVGILQQRKDERDFNYTKVGTSPHTDLNKNLQPLKRTQQKQDWVRPQVVPPMDKKSTSGSSNASVSYSSSPSVHPAVAPQIKLEARYASGGPEAKTKLQPAALKEPVIVMQRPQSNGNQNLPSTSIGSIAPVPSTMGWYTSGATNTEMMKMAAVNVGSGQQLRNVNSIGSSQLLPQQIPQNPYQPPYVLSQMEPNIPRMIGSRSPAGTSGTWRTPPLANPFSLGLFSGWGSSGSSGSSSALDWNTGGSMPHCDYTSVDWSVDVAALDPATVRPNQLYDTARPRPPVSFPGANTSRPAFNGGMRMQDSSSHATDPSTQEWTSPFNGEDMFRGPRKFVKSPSP